MLKPNTSVTDIIFQALCNEVRLDQRYREIFETKGFFIDYKIMKQVALKSKLGILLTPAMFSLAWVTPAILLIRWFLMLIVSIYRPADKGSIHTIWIVPSTPTNETLIRSSLNLEKQSQTHTSTLNNLSETLPRRMSVSAVMAVGGQTLFLIFRIILLGPSRTALLLHTRDVIILLLLARFARSHPHDEFVTDCHYQRWSFILSHTAKKVTLVQHGTLDLGIELPYKGGEVQQVIVRDEVSAKGWGQYYLSIKESVVYSPYLELDVNAYSNNGLFLASSFPMIELEISFIRALLQVAPIPIIVKLHPAHRYDNRRLQLISLADYVCRPDENPSCSVFISHSSSMEMIYRQHGTPTISLQQEGTIGAAIEAVLRAIAKENDAAFKN
jgi:hypothetical protein